MGGFAGGDEAGFWDEDTLAVSIKKQYENKTKRRNNIKASIQRSDSGCSIKSYVKGKELYNTISFVTKACDSFTLEGYDETPLESNTIYKAYLALLEYTDDSDISDFFNEHKVVIKKGVISQTDLEASPSDTAAFMFLIKEVCNLILSTDELVKIGSSIGIDAAFFMQKSI
jgi:4-diphosphocytidyl-2-C-methyl-D-erythritol kinase